MLERPRVIDSETKALSIITEALRLIDNLQTGRAIQMLKDLAPVAAMRMEEGWTRIDAMESKYDGDFGKYSEQELRNDRILASQKVIDLAMDLKSIYEKQKPTSSD